MQKWGFLLKIDMAACINIITANQHILNGDKLSVEK